MLVSFFTCLLVRLYYCTFLLFVVAVENGLDQLQYVQYPKPAGFLVCLELFRKYRNIVKETPVLHDITLAYRDYTLGKRTSDASILKG